MTWAFSPRLGGFCIARVESSLGPEADVYLAEELGSAARWRQLRWRPDCWAYDADGLEVPVAKPTQATGPISWRVEVRKGATRWRAGLSFLSPARVPTEKLWP